MSVEFQTPEVAAPPLRPRKRGRPAKAQPPQNAEQTRLGAAVADAEARRDAAEDACQADPSVATELAHMQSELIAATAWSAYLRSTGDHTAAIKYSDSASKFAGRVAQLRELAATDLLAELAGRARRESDLGRRLGGR